MTGLVEKILTGVAVAMFIGSALTVVFAALAARARRLLSTPRCEPDCVMCALDAARYAHAPIEEPVV